MSATSPTPSMRWHDAAPEPDETPRDVPWLEWLAVLVAAGLMTSPLVLHEAALAPVLNGWVVGALVASANLTSLPRVRLHRSGDLLNIVFGMWLILSPVALDFLGDAAAAIVTTGAGLLIAMLGFKQIARAFPRV